MATTWVNEGNGEQYFIQRHDHVDRIIVLTWGFGDQDTTTVWTDLEAADSSLRSTPISVSRVDARRAVSGATAGS